MKKILLTESQVTLLTEEITKNDKIQKLIFSTPAEISFEVENEIPSSIPTNKKLFRLTPVINGYEYDNKFVNLLAEEVKFGDDTVYQLHINVNQNFRRLGIAEKLYTAFILEGYPVCSLYKNRTSTFFAANGEEKPGDEAIGNLWSKLSANPLIHTEDINIDGKSIGVLAYKKGEGEITESELICENVLSNTVFYGCHTFKDYASRILHIAETSTIITLSIYIQTIKSIPSGTIEDKQQLLNQVEKVIEKKQDNIEKNEINKSSAFALSNSGLEHIKSYEKFSATPYYATKHEENLGKRTIGYGHVITSNDPDWLINAKSITEKQASDILKNDIQLYVSEYNKAISKLPKFLQNPNLYPQGFIDAGISMLYNCGYTNFVNSKFFKTWKACRIDRNTGKVLDSDYNYTIAMIQSSCVKQNGKVISGLVNRRKTEYEMSKMF